MASRKIDLLPDLADLVPCTAPAEARRTTSPRRNFADAIHDFADAILELRAASAHATSAPSCAVPPVLTSSRTHLTEPCSRGRRQHVEPTTARIIDVIAIDWVDPEDFVPTFDADIDLRDVTCDWSVEFVGIDDDRWLKRRLLMLRRSPTVH
jgi:hypothetical protein